MNLIDLGKTSLPAALEVVRTELAKLGTFVDYTEPVGPMQLDDLIQISRNYLSLPDLARACVLEAGLWGGMDVLR